MSRLRHKKEHEGHKEHEKHRAEGGKVHSEGNPSVIALAHERAHGGRVEGEPSKEHLGRRRGGKAHRARGGKVGANEHPYSSAHAHGGKVEGHKGHHRGR